VRKLGHGTKELAATFQAGGSQVRRVGFVVYDGANILDLAGPMQVFATASEQAEQFGGGRSYEVRILSAAGGPVRCSAGPAMESEPIDRFEPGALDTLLVVGGHGAFEAAADPRLLDWLRRQGLKCRRMGSICTGTFVLAAAGLMQGRRVVTHWDYIERFQASFPHLRIESDAIYCEDGPFWTSAGVTAGLDMALALVERDLGHALALRTARRLVFYLHRPGGQAQFSVHLEARSVRSARLQKVVDRILERPSAKLGIDSLARLAAMSKRTFLRSFQRELSMTPAEFIRRSRLETARRLLEQSKDGVEQVSVKSGFSSRAAMRRAFQSQLKVSPQAYRERFRLSGQKNRLPPSSTADR
jgi:transcriptional regulator GlxA family with amidase domain